MKVYIFPRVNSKNDINPYIRLMEDTFKSLPDTSVISASGGLDQVILDLFRCLRTDLLVVNWPETLGDRRFPLAQLIVYTLLLSLSSLLGIRILWIFHNKESHIAEGWIGRFCSQVTAKFATIVLTHSKEGCSYYRERFQKTNIYYFPHPPYVNEICADNKEVLYDIILWGGIYPYKRVAEFLEYSESDVRLKGKRILVCGNCRNQGYLERINRIAARNENIIFQNDFISKDILNNKINHSRVVLFTYANRSVLSSGALVYSLPFCKSIIGPNIGAFIDLEELGLVKTFKSFKDIYRLLENEKVNVEYINEYIQDYSWKNCIEFIVSKLN